MNLSDPDARGRARNNLDNVVQLFEEPPVVAVAMEEARPPAEPDWRERQDRRDVLVVEFGGLAHAFARIDEVERFADAPVALRLAGGGNIGFADLGVTDDMALQAIRAFIRESLAHRIRKLATALEREGLGTMTMQRICQAFAVPYPAEVLG
jgi:hypothetical protein